MPTSGPKLIKEGDRYHSYGINLNHNALNGPLETLPDFVRTILIDPNALSTLDLSFNVFTEIPAVREYIKFNDFNDIYRLVIHTFSRK